MAKSSALIPLVGFFLISATATGQDWRDRVGQKFELTEGTWLDKATLEADRARESSACREPDRFNRSYEVVRNFFRDPRSFSDDLIMNTKIKLSCDCARWIVTKQRAEWQDVLDYAELPRCGPGSARRECLEGSELRACARGEDPFPYQKELTAP